MLYRFYGNSEFKIGDRICIPDGCGLDSNKHGVVINHFPYREEEGAYKPPEKHHVPIQLDDHQKHYFPRNMLLHENRDYHVRMTNSTVIYIPKKQKE
jgi:hypothetical protein